MELLGCSDSHEDTVRYQPGLCHLEGLTGAGKSDFKTVDIQDCRFLLVTRQRFQFLYMNFSISPLECPYSMVAEF